MLKQLYIRNLALVDELTIDFNAGLTVISGETGAGKSLLLNALGLALGDRFHPNLAEANQTGQVVATFSLEIEQHPALQWLENRDLLDGSDCLLRRSFSASGNRCFINNVPVTQSQIGELGDMLIELHGQHQHHSLLQQVEQSRLFDTYCQHSELSRQVSKSSREIKVLNTRIDALKQSLQQAKSDRQYIGFQLQELEELAPQQDEYNRLDQQQKHTGTRQQLMDTLRQATDWLDGDEPNNTTGALSTISLLGREFSRLSIDSYHEITTTLEQIGIQLTDMSAQLHDLQHQEPLDDEQIFQLEQRLAQWHALSRKHHVEPEALPELLSTFRQKLEGLDQGDDQIRMLTEQCDALNNIFLQSCDQLSEQRQQALEPFANQVTKLIRTLSMPDASFRVDGQIQNEPTAHGHEKIRFMVQTNPGSSEGPLNTIASGGELSRISLAIHRSNHQAQQYSRCMVFDEIDVGMSGAVAEHIGQLLRSLSTNSQIICITHQPQVVARAHQHLLAHKHSDQETTTIALRSLDDRGSIEEIARMLGSAGTMEKSLELAQEMYQIGQQG